MDEFWDLSMPWWHFVLRATVVYVVLLVMVRLSGKRTVGQFTPFDMVLLILLGTAVQNSLIGDDISLGGGLILAGTLIFLNMAVGWACARWPGFQRLVEGDAERIIEHGRLDARRLRRASLSLHDLHEALRRHGLEHVDQVERAWIETDGRISLVKRESRGD